MVDELCGDLSHTKKFLEKSFCTKTLGKVFGILQSFWKYKFVNPRIVVFGTVANAFCEIPKTEFQKQSFWN